LIVLADPAEDAASRVNSRAAVRSAYQIHVPATGIKPVSSIVEILEIDSIFEFSYEIQVLE